MRKIIAITSLAVLAACGHSPITDYDASRNFAAMNRYAWTAPSTALAYGDTIVNDNLSDQRVREAVDTVLAEKDMHKVDAEQADILVAYRLVTRVKLNANSTSVGVGMYGPPGVGVGSSVTVSEYKETELFVDMTDPKTALLVWRGSVRYSTRADQSPEERKEEIREKVDSILSEFPPE